MNSYLAYFLGLLTSLLIVLLAYIFAWVIPSFQKVYLQTVCTFPSPNNNGSSNKKESGSQNK